MADTYRVVLSSTAQPPGSNPDYWSTGAFDQIGISIGFEDEAAVQHILGQVDDIEYDLTGRTITLSGRDLSAPFIDTKTAEKFQNQTSSEIAQTLADRHGLGYDVEETDTKAGTYYNIDHTLLTQEQSEWDLLIFLAEQEGFDVWVSGNTLYFQPSPITTNPAYVIEWSEPGDGTVQSNATFLKLGRSETLAKDIEVHVLSFNQKGQESILGVAKAFGAKRARAGKAQLYTFRRPNLTRDQAQQLAQSLLADITRHEMTLNASLPGDNILTTRTMVNLVGTGTAWDQLYYPDSVTRRLSLAEGYRMDVRAKNHSTQSTV